MSVIFGKHRADILANLYSFIHLCCQKDTDYQKNDRGEDFAELNHLWRIFAPITQIALHSEGSSQDLTTSIVRLPYICDLATRVCGIGTRSAICQQPQLQKIGGATYSLLRKSTLHLLVKIWELWS